MNPKIIYGSIKALTQNNLKKRLAYSTVSQVSYIALGTAILGPIGTIGGIVHLVHQGIMKITLFFAAGAIFYELLAGRPLFRSTSVAEHARHLYAPRPRPSQSRLDLPDAFDQITLRALAADRIAGSIDSNWARRLRPRAGGRRCH